MEEGKINRINIFKDKGEPPISLKSVNCSLDFGLENDRFAKGGEKQLTLIDKSTTDWIEKIQIKGLCFEKFKANLTTENLDTSLLNSGDILFCGSAILEVSTEKKECFEECILRQKNIECKIAKGGIYLKVKGSGCIKIGDRIKSKL